MKAERRLLKKILSMEHGENCVCLHDNGEGN